MSSVLFDNVVTGRQTQACALANRLGGEKGSEYLVLMLLRDASTRISHGQVNMPILQVMIDADTDPAGGARL